MVEIAESGIASAEENIGYSCAVLKKILENLSVQVSCQEQQSREFCLVWHDYCCAFG